MLRELITRKRVTARLAVAKLLTTGDPEWRTMTDEYGTRYGATVDPNGDSSHAQIVDLVGHDKRVLDVGTSTGYLAEVMVRNGCSVTGIELDPEAARQAEKYCERVVIGDVENLDLETRLGGESFDVIVFGDVLEHLREPLRTLRRLKHFLRFGGYAVASIPNIAHGSVRLALLQGRFEYHPLGLLDDTHLRFFTRKSAEQLFKDAGFQTIQIERSRLGIFDTEIEIDEDLIPKEALQAVRRDPEALTYQFVVAARPDGEVDVPATASSEELIYGLTRKLRRLEELRRLHVLRTEQLAEKEREVARLTQEVWQLKSRLAKMAQSGKGEA
jgi:2-polyprenyl-3-methyl-5-hydroxy-6-metoxy-1,4-benzoquinol methylase